MFDILISRRLLRNTLEVAYPYKEGLFGSYLLHQGDD